MSPFIYLKRFRDSEDFIMAAVVLDERGMPERTYLVPSRAWATDTSGCISRNDNGGEAGPYVEVRTTTPKHAAALSAYVPERVLATL